ncbi:hypothetical protein ABL850_31685 [Variovorax paradoxus]|jgi:hypothetical protein|uniref:hypothetical protein n=1 Tax=Variovorax paradoxus TaxID=34073 RepID=UPI003AAB58C7
MKVAAQWTGGGSPTSKIASKDAALHASTCVVSNMETDHVAEIGDLRRFAHPRRLMGYFGKRPFNTPLDAGSTKELQQIALAVVDLVDERVI